MIKHFKSASHNSPKSTFNTKSKWALERQHRLTLGTNPSVKLVVSSHVLENFRSADFPEAGCGIRRISRQESQQTYPMVLNSRNLSVVSRYSFSVGARKHRFKKTFINRARCNERVDKRLL